MTSIANAHKKERRHQYYLSHRDEELAHSREYIAKNRTRLSALAREWRRRNKDSVNARRRERYATDSTRVLDEQKRHRDKVRARIFEIYGTECTCCHEKDKRFLSLGHIKNDGYLDRQKYNNNAHTMYAQAIKNPDLSRYDIQCFNCNMGARINGGICPHKTSSEGLRWTR